MHSVTAAAVWQVQNDLLQIHAFLERPLRLQAGLPMLAEEVGQVVMSSEVFRLLRRGFLDSADLVPAAVGWAIVGGPSSGRPLAGCTHTTDWVSLAERIRALDVFPPVLLAIDPAAEPQDYTAYPGPDRALLRCQGSHPGRRDQLQVEMAPGIAAGDRP